MTPLLCSSACLADGYTGYASVSSDRCSCSNMTLPLDERRMCDVKCKTESWLNCGGNNGAAVLRALTFYGVSIHQRILAKMKVILCFIILQIIIRGIKLFC